MRSRKRLCGRRLGICPPRIAAVADDLSARDRISDGNRSAFQMRVVGAHAVRMLDHDVSAVGPEYIVFREIALVVRRDDLSALDRHDRIAVPDTEVHASVIAVEILRHGIVVAAVRRVDEGHIIDVLVRTDHDDLFHGRVGLSGDQLAGDLLAAVIRDPIDRLRIAVGSVKADLRFSCLQCRVIFVARCEGNRLC